jgi:hypothetical protein
MIDKPLLVLVLGIIVSAVLAYCATIVGLWR